MAKFGGKIGFVITSESESETNPGVFEQNNIERVYYGDILRNIRRLQSTEKVNDDVTLSNELSIVADPFANENFHCIRYVEYMGTKWKVESVEVLYPRLKLTLGGVYNG